MVLSTPRSHLASQHTCIVSLRFHNAKQSCGIIETIVESKQDNPCILQHCIAPIPNAPRSIAQFLR